MVLLQDGLLAFLSAVGLTTVVWLVTGLVCCTGQEKVPGLLLVLPLRGDAPAMEADVRQLRRLQGQLPGAKIVLADCGLTEEARGLAQYLAAREKNAGFVDGKEFQLT
ncbi:MAG: glutathionylspermidine synthase family protein [Ruminococcaceae bacterium]|nr:glutathionylspermidine synthase family protein [Oscillospiraceae bacterium]